jgi:hypothetical protein
MLALVYRLHRCNGLDASALRAPQGRLRRPAKRLVRAQACGARVEAALLL